MKSVIIPNLICKKSSILLVNKTAQKACSMSEFEGSLGILREEKEQQKRLIRIATFNATPQDDYFFIT
jgi:hypothetical protein